jgi:deoxyribodipyrimidine photo-lyase
MNTLLWFRRDLRLLDLSLLAAADGGAQVLACFVIDSQLEASAGARRMRFLCDSLRELRESLDGRLFVTADPAQQRIPAIAKQIGASAVHISADFTPYGRRRDDAVGKALGDTPLVATGSPYLVSPPRAVKPDGTPYKVFTPFFQQWQEAGWPGPADSHANAAF